MSFFDDFVHLVQNVKINASKIVYNSYLLCFDVHNIYIDVLFLVPISVTNFCSLSLSHFSCFSRLKLTHIQSSAVFAFVLPTSASTGKMLCPSGFLRSKPALFLFLQVFVPPRCIYFPWSFNSLMGSGSIALFYFIFFSLFFWDIILDTFYFLSRKTTLIAYIFYFFIFYLFYFIIYFLFLFFILFFLELFWEKLKILGKIKQNLRHESMKLQLQTFSCTRITFLLNV